ncbi:NAD-dependent epimerase/dehydratase family protein [Catellatospora sp. IY07-71]|uniref:NAD-dependent epimerase/dehydratase family protein n=1 Tax=Catellatospora sp. IY07-71 TaxID=2728827 RepID=UPI001FCFCE7A|nr:NAD-dependent epimerase/dehydratase family protein [Catellatospora sp. IY07-71]
MRILVIGGSGLIGAHVTDVLGERGHTVSTVGDLLLSPLFVEPVTGRSLDEAIHEDSHDGIGT